MAEQVRIEMPRSYPFSCEVKIRATDITLGLHVSFATVLDLVFEAHLRFFRFLGHEVTDVHGLSLIFASAIVVYRAELLADDLVRIEVAAENFHSTGCDLFFRLTKDDGARPVTDVKIDLRFFDYTARRVALMPEAFRIQCLQVNHSQGA